MKKREVGENLKVVFNEHLEPGLDVVPQLLPVDGDVVLVHPVGVEDGPGHSLLSVDVGKVPQGDLVPAGQVTNSILFFC